MEQAVDELIAACVAAQGQTAAVELLRS